MPATNEERETHQGIGCGLEETLHPKPGIIRVLSDFTLSRTIKSDVTGQIVEHANHIMLEKIDSEVFVERFKEVVVDPLHRYFGNMDTNPEDGNITASMTFRHEFQFFLSVSFRI